MLYPRVYSIKVYYKNLIQISGQDVIAQAQSGTGKTATFSIAILQQINMALLSTQALVLAPTRELAQQVSFNRSKLLLSKPICCHSRYSLIYYLNL